MIQQITRRLFQQHVHSGSLRVSNIHLNLMKRKNSVLCSFEIKDHVSQRRLTITPCSLGRYNTLPGNKPMKHQFSLQRYFSTNMSEDEAEDVENPDADGKEVNELLDDIDYDLYLREYCSIPGVGHRLYVIQPVIRTGPKVNLLTSGSLQLEEAVALVNTLPRWTVVKQETVNIRRSGEKLMFTPNQIGALTKKIRDSRGVTAVFVSVNLLSSHQLAVYGSAWRLPVFDRYTLVLQIFKEHARTKAAKLQVSLAEVPYIRSRLNQIQAGSTDAQIGEAKFAGGTGRGYVMIRNRVLRERERRLKTALDMLKRHRSLLRDRRLQRKIPIIAVVGYTNSGKTTLIKALTNDLKMAPQDKLFATLDVTAHGGYLPNHMKVIFMDTVGFISDIPISLISAFSATLEDALLADIVIHVRDLSHPDATAQKHTVLHTLRRMLSQSQMDNIIEVCNKVDKLTEPPNDQEGLCISAVTGHGLNDLRLSLQQKLLASTGYLQKSVRIPMSGPHLSWLYKEATVIGSEPDASQENLIVDIVITEAAYAKFKSSFGKKSINNTQLIKR